MLVLARRVFIGLVWSLWTMSILASLCSAHSDSIRVRRLHSLGMGQMHVILQFSQVAYLDEYYVSMLLMTSSTSILSYFSDKVVGGYLYLLV
jgi:hypothetical protein